ncbi:MAG: DUF4390 domain-containing protein [Gammaproteobacteria bacterium]|nr:DUF4390 domain-containing protein [Gammaproteobacteria bacterium]MDH5650469.1 DUF4390 domain-containing protein [Gammaproteobacteria bacterium]
MRQAARSTGIGLLFAALLLPQSGFGAEFIVRSVATELKDDVYQLNARIDYTFSEEAQRALQSGIPLIILMDIQVDKQRSWWWNKEVAHLQQGYLLIYHALTKKYIINNLNSGAQQNHKSFTAALQTLGQITGLPLIDKGLIEADARYQIHLRVYLDIESLPAPMRPLAWLSSDWRLSSDWYTWPLQP